MAALPVCHGAEVWRWLLFDPWSYVKTEAAGHVNVDMSSCHRAELQPWVGGGYASSAGHWHECSSSMGIN
jgi:hypothetical protein